MSMTLDQAMARIAELELENKRLSGMKVEQRSVLPVDAAKIAPFLFQSNGYLNYSTEINNLTHSIRRMCFPTKKKQRYYRKDNRTMSTTCALTLTDMTVDQYNEYLKAVRKILEAMYECRLNNFVGIDERTDQHDGGY